MHIQTNHFSYVTIDREWKNGDVVSVSLPMKTTMEYLPDGSPWVSFLKGPIVLSAVTGTDDTPGLFANGERMAHIAYGDYYPIDEAPALITNDPAELPDNLVEHAPMKFTISPDVYSDPDFSELELVPFYTIHEARYMMYWPVFTKQSYQQQLEEVRAREAAALALEARTVDQVGIGEHQPETEHNFKGKGTETGMYANRFWRHASGWFSYDLKNPGLKASILQVTYAGGDQGRSFDILINGTILESINLERKESAFYEVNYVIPVNLQKELMTVRFEAHENSIAGGIYGLRLLKEE